MFKKLFALLILAASFCYGVVVHVDVSDPYVKITPPGVKNSAIFMDIRNNTDKPIKLIKASSSVSQTSELHTHISADGMMKMVQIDDIEIPANGGEANLKPGGLHIMLINIKKPIVTGDKVDVMLEFDNGMTINLNDIPAKNIVK